MDKEDTKSWITLSSNLMNGNAIINKLDSKKFQLFLNRVMKDMLQNPDSHKPFTDEEEEKLLISLEVERHELDILIRTIIVIISQATYSLTNPERLKDILVGSLKLSSEKAEIFSTSWANDAKNLMLKFKQKSVYSRKLQDLSWLVNIEISNEDNRQTFIPKALLQMKLTDDNATSDITLDMDEGQLSKLYNSLEDIQTALDSLM